MYRWGTYMWTANSAGWAVIAYVSRVPEAWIVCVLCGGIAVLWPKPEK